MLLCRAACQKLAHFAWKSTTPLSRNVPVRSMAYGLPGGSGQNVAFVVLCGGSITVAAVYAYRTMISDSERHIDRRAELDVRPKDPWEPKDLPVNTPEQVSEAKEEAPKSLSPDTGEMESVTTGVVAEVTAVDVAVEAVSVGAEAAAGTTLADATDVPDAEAVPATGAAAAIDKSDATASAAEEGDPSAEVPETDASSAEES